MIQYISKTMRFLFLLCFVFLTLPLQCDIFQLNAVDLGDLTTVKVSHDGAGLRSGWFLEKVVIKQTAESETRYVFRCDK